MNSKAKTAIIVTTLCLVPVGLGIGYAVYKRKNSNSVKASESAENNSADTTSDTATSWEITASAFPIKYNPSVCSNNVKKIQSLLNSKGANLKVDGYYGDATANAVKKYANTEDGKTISTENWVALGGKLL